MPLIIITVLLAGLKYFTVGPFAAMSWWWVTGMFLVTFIWFEFGERMLGLDKRKAHEQMDKAREDRVKQTFKK